MEPWNPPFHKQRARMGQPSCVVRAGKGIKVVRVVSAGCSNHASVREVQGSGLKRRTEWERLVGSD